MTSLIEVSGIDETYPVAGQDNDSQGFRDNFGNIKAALDTAKTEITKLQSTAVLKSNLTTDTTVTNNLAGSTIRNGKLTQMAGTYLAATSVGGTYQIDLGNAAFYTCYLEDGNSVQFKGWPSGWDTPGYSSVRVMMKSNNSSSNIQIHLTAAGAYPITMDGSSSWATQYSATSVMLQLNSTQKWKLVEAFSFDGGHHVYVRYLGEY